MTSASVVWVLSETRADAAVTQALGLLAFALGGVGFVVPLGLLVAGVAVPALMLHLAPRWYCFTGVGVAAVAEASFLSMALEPLQLLLPVGRFGGLLWMLGIGFLLPRTPTADSDGTDR